MVALNHHTLIWGFLSHWNGSPSPLPHPAHLSKAPAIARNIYFFNKIPHLIPFCLKNELPSFFSCLLVTEPVKLGDRDETSIRLIPRPQRRWDPCLPHNPTKAKRLSPSYR